MKSTLATIMAASVASTVAAQTYRLVDLGTIAGESHAFFVSDTGRVVGSSTKVNAHFVGAELGTGPAGIGGVPGYGETVVFAVDADGNALGVSYALGGVVTQALRNDGTSAATLGGFTPRAVNASGVIAGTIHTPDANGFVLPRACSFSGGVLTTLPTLGGVTGQAFGVDGLGRIFGSSTTLREAASRPCVWSGGVARDLGTLSASATATGQAWAAQGAGVVGASQNAAGLFRATRWTLDSAGNVVSRADMGGLSTAPSYAYAVNASGDAVGTSGFHAVVYREGGAVDLNTVIEGGVGSWTLERAWSISDAGVIVGDGSLLGFPRAFALYPCSGACCDDIDFNRDGLFPDTVDIDAFLSTFSGAPCATPSCGDIDFNNDGLFPDTTDIEAMLSVFSGGVCVR